MNAFLTGLLADWKMVAIKVVAAIVILGLLYAYAYQRGSNACATKQAAASLTALLSNQKVNDLAMSTELSLATERARTGQIILNKVDTSHEATDDDAAAPIIQRTFDELRQLDGQAPAHQ